MVQLIHINTLIIPIQKNIYLSAGINISWEKLITHHHNAPRKLAIQLRITHLIIIITII